MSDDLIDGLVGDDADDDGAVEATATPTKGTRGGYRPGAGRKLKRDKNGTAIEKAEKQIRDRLPTLVEKMFELAYGGIESIEEEYQPAWVALQQQQAKERKRERGRGEQPGDVPDGLELDEDTIKENSELVLIKRKFSRTLPDKQALVYLIDRIMGKPVAKIAPTTPDGKEEYGAADTSDEARINRLAAIFDLARARRSDGAPGHASDVDSATGSADDGGSDAS